VGNATEVFSWAKAISTSSDSKKNAIERALFLTGINGLKLLSGQTGAYKEI